MIPKGEIVVKTNPKDKYATVLAQITDLAQF